MKYLLDTHTALWAFDNQEKGFDVNED